MYSVKVRKARRATEQDTSEPETGKTASCGCHTSSGSREKKSYKACLVHETPDPDETKGVAIAAHDGALAEEKGDTGSKNKSATRVEGGVTVEKLSAVHESPNSFEVEQLCFSAGNPRVEHITGVVHLYRHVQGDDGNQGEISEQPNVWGTQTTPLLPMERGKSLCVLSLPPDCGFAEFCTFLGPYFELVKEIRLVRRHGGQSSVSCLVLLEFARQDSADDFYLTMNGKEFCLLEPEMTCQLVFVKNIEITRADDIEDETSAKEGATEANENDMVGAQEPKAAVKLPSTAPPGTTELPSCPVCLDRLDANTSGIVTTVCNHRFHNQCLRQWADTSCPVCRYCQAPRNGAPKCASCNAHNDLWACLVCGHVGCGRYLGSHAHAHWLETGHGYSLELETQRVWDYCSDAYVHRLVRSRTDGKVVEVSSKDNEGTGSGATSDTAHLHQQDEEKKSNELMSASKLDSIVAEYNHLLVTQLESQRSYFENIAARTREEYEITICTAQEQIAESNELAAKAKIASEKQEKLRIQLESKLNTAKTTLENLRKEKDFLKQLNETLLANQKDFVTRERDLTARLEHSEAECTELREQVRDLMIFIQARDTIDSASATTESNDLSGATVLPLPKQKGRRRKKN